MPSSIAADDERTYGIRRKKRKELERVVHFHRVGHPYLSHEVLDEVAISLVLRSFWLTRKDNACILVFLDLSGIYMYWAG